MKKIFLTGSTGYVGTKFIELYGHIYDILGVARSDITSSLDLSDLATVKTRVLDFSPDVIIHTAVALGRDSSVPDDIIEISTTITKNLVDIATTLHIPFIFTSTEAVYGRKNDGNYLETDTLLPRNIYGKSKVLCEEIIQQSNLSYLITRGHRHIGWSKNFHRTKQFPDTITALLSGETLHFDSKKIFTPVFINNLCDWFHHYIQNDTDKQLLLNIGIDKNLTYYQIMSDVARILNIDEKLILADGNEVRRPDNNILCIEKAKSLHYPIVSYEQTLQTLQSDFLSL